MAKKTYFEKLKDPRWQKMRLKVLERDDWTCQCCCDPDSTLAVHHRYYISGCEPWDYPMEALVTLCEECHTEERENRPQEERLLLEVLRRNFMASDLNDLAIAFHKMKLSTVPERVSAAYSWAIRTPAIQEELIKRHEARRSGHENP